MLKQLLKFIYPSRCCHCTQAVSQPNKILCEMCSAQISLVYDPIGSQVMSCFERHSVGNSLLVAFEKTQLLRLNQLIVSFMVVQYMRHHQYLPKWIVPALQKNRLGNNWVAEELSKARAYRFESKVLLAFKQEIGASISDGQGNLNIKINLHQKTLKRIQKQEPILIVSNEGEILLSIYRPLQHMDITMSAISVLFYIKMMIYS